jgi:dTDP-4-amino-4,6-dideoxygalactose transaminase
MSHHVSCGVGGMILTNSKRYDQIARSYMNHGRIDDGTHFQFGRVGYSSRATEMEAAIGCAALEHVDTDLVQRQYLAKWYITHLHDLPIQYTPYHPDHSWMFYPIKLKGASRQKLMAHLKQFGIESREAMPLISQPVFKKLYKAGSCPVAEDWTKNGLLLPLHPQMSDIDVHRVCRVVRRFFER